MNDSIFDYEILPTNYTIFHKDRRSRGGGVLVAVESSLSCYEVASPPDLEVMSVKIGHILCTVYITPNIDTGSLITLLSYLADLSSSSEHLLIVGDFNAPDIEWSSLTGTQSHSNLICDFFFMQISHKRSLNLHIPKDTFWTLSLPTVISFKICKLILLIQYPLRITTLSHLTLTIITSQC